MQTNDASLLKGPTRSGIITLNSDGPDIDDVKSYLKFFQKIDGDRIHSIRKLDLSDSAHIFLVNLKNDSGWLIISGDYDYKPVIAHSEEGNINLSSSNSSFVKGWLAGIANNIVENRSNADSREVNNNQRKWKAAKLLSIQESVGTRDGDEPDTLDSWYEYTIDTLVNQHYPALTVTKWHPVEPFNSAVPLYNSNERCLTGCVPVALAQFLYYTHYAYNVPAQSYSYAECNSYYYQHPYSFGFYNLSAYSWNNMALNDGDIILHSTQPVAALIAFMSYVTITDYSDGEGSTSSFFIPAGLASMGINNAVCNNYSRSSIMTEISNGRPVIGDGLASLTATYGHCFLYDGYSRLYTLAHEVIYDIDGSILEENYFYDDDVEWHINSGSAEPGFYFLFWTDENSFYPYQRSIYTGWTY